MSEKKNKEHQRKKIVIAGGGTGGHIYPAIAMARALLKKDPDIDIHFVGTAQGLETKIIPREGWPLHLLNVGKLNYAGSYLKKLMTLLRIPWAFVQSSALLFELKPQAVLGVGGYASGPFVLIASLLGFRASLWEPNAIPGLTNRWLSRFVRRSYIVFEDARKFLHSNEIKLVGLPVREVLESQIEKHAPRTDNFFHVLVFGGSQGARAINQVVCEAILSEFEWRKNIKFMHQTGPLDFADIQNKYKDQKQIEAREYLHDMEKQYAWADLVICRAGASTVAEIAACGKATLFIPLPWAADDHQVKNAQTLVDASAADMILQKDLSKDVLVKKIQDLSQDPAKLKSFESKVKMFYKAKAADRMADLLLNQMGDG
ncbi:MAG: undecaprenyldiphospho-muramoylpentapeptide beta-N-acetylglucosaminyltransferase [Bdellovibrionota bacterium]